MGWTAAAVGLMAASTAYSAYSSRQGRKDAERSMQKRTWAEQVAMQEAERAEAKAEEDRLAAEKATEMETAAKDAKRRKDMAMFGREGTFKTSMFGLKDQDQATLSRKTLFGQ